MAEHKAPKKTLDGALSGQAEVLPSFTSASATSYARPTLTLDLELYEAYLADSNLTKAEKREFIEALWSIIVAFVDLGYGVHPLQQIDDETPSLDLALATLADSSTLADKSDTVLAMAAPAMVPSSNIKQTKIEETSAVSHPQETSRKE